MNNKTSLELAAKLIGDAYSQQGAQSLRTREKLVQNLLTQRCLPEQGWDDETIEHFMEELAIMDSNNFIGNVGAGEREARVFSSLVSRRHFGMAHGMGRSGDVNAVQPKAAGSSLMVQLCNYMAAHALRIAGMPKLRCLVLPLATGMTITLTLLAMKNRKPDARYVIWPRIDQKTCLKAISSTGCIPVVIENLLEGDELRTDVAAIEAKIAELGAENIVCVASTTSCFAPRCPERLVEVAQLCKAAGIMHLVNNAYGVQAASTTQLFVEAVKKGRVDVIVQSTDKNFLVPVGGAILACNDKELMDSINTAYPGRASAAPIMDLFITLLSMGASGYKALLAQRKACYVRLQKELGALAAKHGERLLSLKHNPISLGLTLESFIKDQEDRRGITFLGSMLFSRNVSGTRAVSGKGSKTVAGIEFPGYGAHANEYPVPYLTAAAAMGMTEADVDNFCKRVDTTLTELRGKLRKLEEGAAVPKNAPPTADAAPAATRDVSEVASPQKAATVGSPGLLTVEFEPNGWLITIEVDFDAPIATVYQASLSQSDALLEEEDYAELVQPGQQLFSDSQEPLHDKGSLASAGVKAGGTIYIVDGAHIEKFLAK